MRRPALAPAAAGGMLAAAIVLASCTSGGGGTSTAPTASPVKERIAFDRMTGAINYGGSYLGTIIANANGTGQQRLPIPKGWSGPVSPVWSPDGRKLVVSVFGKSPGYGLPGPGRAAIVAPDGSGRMVLAHRPGRRAADRAQRPPHQRLRTPATSWRPCGPPYWPVSPLRPAGRSCRTARATAEPEPRVHR